MADNQRIHPVDLEASPTVPLHPRSASISEKGDPDEKLSRYHTAAPPLHSRPRKRSHCGRCLCWTLFVLFMFVIIIGAATGILYLIFKPKIPTYSVDSLSITNFVVDTNDIVTSEFRITVTTTNPNRKIGISYETGSHFSVWFSNASLCTGSIPKFHQGYQNTTVLEVTLTGQTQINNALIEELRRNQQTGNIPLVFKGKVPVRVNFGKLKLMKVTFRVNCDVLVNSLLVNNQIRIRNSKCAFHFSL